MFGKVLSRRGVAVCAGLTLVSVGGMLVAALLGQVPGFAVAALVAIGVEAYVAGWSGATGEVLERLGVGRVCRGIARDLAVVLLLVGTVELTWARVVTVLLVPAAGWAVAIATDVLGRGTDRVDALSTVTRNIDLGGRVAPERARPGWVSWLTRDRLAYLNALLLPGAVASAALGDLTAYLGTAVVVAAVIIPLAAAQAVHLVRTGATSATPVGQAFRRWMAAARPRVVLYFAGPASDAYQVDMWLAPVEALAQPALVVLRNRETFDALARTSLPVVCIPNPVELMNVGFDPVRVALYPANVGPNIHMLREPGIAHVFVGHGDSDKQASVNPYTKVYDEVWVAGPAARERYAGAAVGVRDSSIVEIGRPQLAALDAAAAPPGDRPFTVLYAPTWEGWVDDPHRTSLVEMGEAVVRELLELTPPVRVIFKPHPLTGTRSRRAAAARDRVVKLIRAAAGEHLVVSGVTPVLFDCFTASDLLISDISGVVADFVQTQRPYVVTNPMGLPEDEFRRQNPTARAAYLLTRNLGELEKIIYLARAGDDPLCAARRELKTYLLGPDEPGPIERFRAEISRLCGADAGAPR